MSEVPLYRYMRVRACERLRSVQRARVVAQVPLYRNVQWFRGGLVFEAHTLLYHSA